MRLLERGQRAPTHDEFEFIKGRIGQQTVFIPEQLRLLLQRLLVDTPLRIVSDKPYTYDVQKRVPAVEKAKRLLGFEATSSLSDALDEIIPWIGQQIEIGGI